MTATTSPQPVPLPAELEPRLNAWLAIDTPGSVQRWARDALAAVPGDLCSWSRPAPGGWLWRAVAYPKPPVPDPAIS